MLSALFNILLPIFLLIGVGWLAGRRLALDRGTLARLNTSILVPALLFLRVRDADWPPGQALLLAVFAVAHIAILGLFAWWTLGFTPWRESRRLLTTAALFPNVGNYGLPLVALAFDPAAGGIIAMLLLVQNVLNFTLGPALLAPPGPRGAAWRAGLLNPVLLAGAAGLLVRLWPAPFPVPLEQALQLLGQGLVPVALITLGVELAVGWTRAPLGPIVSVSLLRFLVAPLVAWGLALALGFPPGVVAVLVVVTALPVAVNVYLVAAQHDREPALASALVLITTLLSAFTVPVWIGLFR